ncbi:MAG: lactate utilization protein [Alphaproteobacteria bacterium]|nr:lactate utilization protein [Alphaproteobacteria bacterium]
MTTSRERVLGDVRKALGKRAQRDEAAEAALVARLEAHAPGTIPDRAQKSKPEQIDLFIQMARDAAATVEEIKTLGAVPDAVAEFLAAHNLPSAIVAAPDPALEAVAWDSRETLEVRAGAAEPSDLTSVTTALAGVAETGTLVLASGPDTPTTLNFMPDNHIVVLHASQIVGDYETVWATLRERAAAGKTDGAKKMMPRAVNWITGPSRSADIEQTLLMGAHGPRRLHILVVRG